MATPTEPLLEKIYYDDCTGCKQEKKKAHMGIPYREFLCISVATMCYIMPVSAVDPYLYFMIRDFDIAKREEDIGYYAGLVGSAFVTGRLLTSIVCWIVADRYGRKPVVVITLLSVLVFNTLFGLSTSYWMAFTTRTLFGIFSGLLGPMKACASEVCRKEHEALGLSIVITSLNIDSVIGSAIGGFLAQVVSAFREFSNNIFQGVIIWMVSIHFTLPYRLSHSSRALVMTYFWFPETLHRHNGRKMGGDKFDGREDIGENDGGILESWRSLIKNSPLMSTMILYAIFCLQQAANGEIFSLCAESSRSYGGLSFSSQQVGEVLAISGLGLLIYQPVLYPCFLKHISLITSIRVAAILSVPSLTSYPFMANLSGFRLLLVVTCVSFLMNLFWVIIMTGVTVLLNNAVSQYQRGAANGIAVCAASFFRALAPAGGGALLSWAQRHQHSYLIPGDHLVFFALNVATVIGFALSFKPFLTLPDNV